MNEEVTLEELKQQIQGQREDKIIVRIGVLNDLISQIEKQQEEIEMAIDRVKIAEKREKQIKELEERIKIYALNGDNIKLELYIKNNYIPTSLIKEKIEELNKEEQEAQNSISDEEREEYSDANISYILMDIETRRRCYEELLGEEK